VIAEFDCELDLHSGKENNEPAKAEAEFFEALKRKIEL
jgi:hypothetical protein